jgi:hypothetical protein
VRNPHRIPYVLAAIGDSWAESPDLRLGQVVANAADGDPYQLEDDELVERLDTELPVEYIVDPDEEFVAKEGVDELMSQEEAVRQFLK